MFLSVLTKSPNDIVIYGRATVLRDHDEVADVASAPEIQRRSWKKKWPYYIRVHRGEFVSGILANGVSLNRLIDTFGAGSFAPTEKRVLKGEKGVDPKGALRQKPAIHLTQRAKVWLNGQLETAFARHGNLAQRDLLTLDWP